MLHMARKRIVTEPALRDWQAVDGALRDIRECNIALKELGAELDRRMVAAKDDYNNASLPLQNRVRRLEADVKEFVDAHRAELCGKSRTLTFGTVGYRRSSQLKLNQSAEDTIALLEAIGRAELVRVTKSLDRAALLRQPAELLDRIDAWVKTTDGFHIDVTSDVPEG